MKKVKLFAAALVATAAFTACNTSTEQPAEQTTTTDETTESAVATYTANTDATEVLWKGEVAGVYGHHGFVNLQSGTVEVTNGQLTGGEFVVDMTEIVPTDSASYKDEEGRRAEDLANHLASDDFFLTSEHPTATFAVTSVEGNTVNGNLTVRGTTNPETFEISNIDITDDAVNMEGTLVFDRQQYNIAFEHPMKDMVLSDDITINVKLVATK